MLDFEKIKKYLKCDQNGLPLDKSLFHAGYDKSVAVAKEIKEVFSEEYPQFMVKKRPKEKQEHTQYRIDFYYNIVGKFRTKALSMVSTVYQNDDFSVIFNKDTDFKEFTEKQMFDNQSLPEWFFSDWSKSYIDDPNSVLAPVFKDFASTDQEFNEPTLKLFSSEGVIQLNKDIAVLRGDEKTWITVTNDKQTGKQKVGRNLYFYDRDSFIIAKQTGITYGNDNTNYTWQIIGQSIFELEGEFFDFEPFQTNTSKVPAQRIGRILGDKIDGEVQLYRSELSDALPFLKKILMRASDSEIEFLLHIHTIEWYITTKHECKEPGCHKGYIDNPGWTTNSDVPPKIKCRKCDDKGFPLNGMETIVHTIDGGSPLDSKNGALSGPFMGYAERNVQTVQELRTEMAVNEAAAYNSLDMLWLFQTPLNTSGKSKAYDRQEWYRRLSDASMHINKQMVFCYEGAASFRYGVIGNIERILPVVNTPQDTFDITTDVEVRDELVALDAIGIDGNLFKNLENNWSKKRFGKESNITKLVDLKMFVDPFVSVRRNKTQVLDLAIFNEIKVFGKDNPKLKPVLQKYYLSKYLDSIIRDLRIENDNFLDLDRNLQIEKINTKLLDYVPDTISEEVYTTIKQEPAVDVVNDNQAA